MSRAAALVLFDIDGTLLRRSGPHHRRALERAVERVTGLGASTGGIPVAGMLDRDILLAMLTRAGLPPARARSSLPAIMETAQNVYARTCPDLRRKVCPGVRAVLGRLHRLGVPMGLVTGNLSRIAWIKLRRAGLDRYFSLGAFAENGSTRALLLRRAIAQARRTRLIAPRAVITYVGDHPNDIQAARRAGVRILAVGTGIVPETELLVLEPDRFVADLRALDPLWLARP